jgi:hypothetical protein
MPISKITATSVADNTLTTDQFSANAVHGVRNLIINGAMQVAQRGTSISPSTGAYSYSLDRWKSYSGSSYTISQQEFSAGQTDVPNVKNYMRIANGASTTSFHQLIEDVTTVSGTSVTLSFYIKGSSSYTLEIGVYQNFGSGGSATVNTANLATVSVTTSWTRVTATFIVPSISGKTVGASSYLRIDIGTGTYYIPASNTTEITGVQLELGEQATPFEHRSFGDELARCQRYFQKSYDSGTALGANTGDGAIFSRIGVAVTNQPIQVVFPVPMRGAPTGTIFSLVGTSGSVSDCSTSFSHDHDEAAIINGTIGQTGFSKISGVSMAAGNIYGFQYTMDAEL